MGGEEEKEGRKQQRVCHRVRKKSVLSLFLHIYYIEDKRNPAREQQSGGKCFPPLTLNCELRKVPQTGWKREACPGPEQLLVAVLEAVRGHWGLGYVGYYWPAHKHARHEHTRHTCVYIHSDTYISIQSHTYNTYTQRHRSAYTQTHTQLHKNAQTLQLKLLRECSILVGSWDSGDSPCLTWGQLRFISGFPYGP